MIKGTEASRPWLCSSQERGRCWEGCWQEGSLKKRPWKDQQRSQELVTIASSRSVGEEEESDSLFVSCWGKTERPYCIASLVALETFGRAISCSDGYLHFSIPLSLISGMNKQELKDFVQLWCLLSEWLENILGHKVEQELTIQLALRTMLSKLSLQINLSSVRWLNAHFSKTYQAWSEQSLWLFQSNFRTHSCNE